MTYMSSTTCASPARRTSLGQRLALMIRTARTRNALKSLDAAALRDIGVSRADAHAEANRPFWDAPQTWRN